jgi:hypothetical protein
VAADKDRSPAGKRDRKGSGGADNVSDGRRESRSTTPRSSDAEPMKVNPVLATLSHLKNDADKALHDFLSGDLEGISPVVHSPSTALNRVKTPPAHLSPLEGPISVVKVEMNKEVDVGGSNRKGSGALKAPLGSITDPMQAEDGKRRTQGSKTSASPEARGRKPIDGEATTLVFSLS